MLSFLKSKFRRKKSSKTRVHSSGTNTPVETPTPVMITSTNTPGASLRIYPGSPPRDSVSLFPNNEQSLVHNPTPTGSSVHSQVLRRLATAAISETDLDSPARYPPPRCHPGTRLPLLQTLESWSRDASHYWQMFWISGPAGSGKSAIAQTFAEFCQEAGQLGAALFLSRSNVRDGNSRIVPTMVHQLSIRYPAYKNCVDAILERDPSILGQGLSAQFNTLIIDPIRQGFLDPVRPLIVILDGLDECGSRDTQRDLVEVIVTSLPPRGNQSPLLWMICSRPEPHLERILPKDFAECRREALNIDSVESMKDVERVFGDGFRRIREHYSRILDLEGWPTEENLRRLVHTASGFFLFVSSALRFVGDSRIGDPKAQLATLLEHLHNRNTATGPPPFKDLDSCYTKICSGIQPHALSTALRILSLCASDVSGPHTPQRIANNLGLAQSTLYDTLNGLHSVLYVPPPEKADTEVLRFYHLSFRDFLQDPTRSGQFTIGDRPDIPEQQLTKDHITPAPAVSSPDIRSPVSEVGRAEFSDSIKLARQDNLVGGVLGSFEVLGDGVRNPNKLDASTNNPEVWVNVLEKLSDVLRTTESRRALCNLKNEQAQLMIDYLHSVLSQPVLPKPWLHKHITMALYQLCEYTRFYPHYYVLRNVDVKSREDGGSLSDVYKGRLGGHILCLKVMRLNKSDTIAALGAYTKEAVLWGEMRHPNIVPFYGIFYLDEAHTQLCLVSPWMKNGDVVGYLKDNPDASRESLIYDVALGLEYLQAQKLVHSDLKGANILVDDDGRACITDFGMTFLRLDAMMPLAIGLSQHLGYPSYRWLAPELAVDDTRPTLKSDIWAFGCVCFEVLSGLLPFHGCRADPQIIMRLHRGELPSGSDPQVIAGIDDDMYKLMSRCWSKDPAGRPSCREILKILRMKGVTGKNVDADRTRRFQLATADETVDLTKIGEILGEL